MSRQIYCSSAQVQYMCGKYSTTTLGDNLGLRCPLAYVYAH